MNSLFACETQPAWATMWSLALAIYFFLKGMSWLCRKSVHVACWKHLAYLFLWPGMDADRFLNSCDLKVSHPSLSEWTFAIFKLNVGVVLLFVFVPYISNVDPYFAGWTGMFGIVFGLHFGIFHILSAVWRTYGRQADPIMNWPIASQSLSEFWGRRWNVAFRDLTHRFLFHPLVPYLGTKGSMLAGFVLSGLIHDLVVSVPAHGGQGGPTTFFILQAFGLLIERSRVGRSIGLGAGLVGRIFCVAALLLPLPLLFHRPFVCNVIVPFLAELRSLTCSST